MNQEDRPASLKKAPKPAADSSIDPIVTTTDPVMPAARPAAAAPSAAAPATKPRREITVPLSTRVSERVIQVLDEAVAREGLTVRAAVEQAILSRFGNHG